MTDHHRLASIHAWQAVARLFRCLEAALVIAVPCWVAGCGKETTKPSPQAGTNTNQGSVLAAPADYLRGAVAAEQSAIKTIDLASVSSAIRQFQVEQGRYPRDLAELVQEKYLPRIPPVPYGSKLFYDPVTGEARVVKQP